MMRARFALLCLAAFLASGSAQAGDARPIPSFTISTTDGSAFETNKAMAQLFQPLLESVLEKCSVMVGREVPAEKPLQILHFSFPVVMPVRLFLPTAGAASEADLDVMTAEVSQGYFYADDVNFGHAALFFSKPDEEGAVKRMVICSPARAKGLLCHPALNVFRTRTCQIHRQTQDRINEQRRALESWEMNVHPSARDEEPAVTE